MKDRLKRMIAFFVDYFIIGFMLILAFLMTGMVGLLFPGLGFVLMVYLLLLIPCCFAVFILRDVIFGGRSIGKRLFGLYVLDKATLQVPNNKQRFLRNVFFFIYLIDGVVLLITGETIGDRVAKTVVLSVDSLEYLKTEQVDITPQPNE